MSNQHNILDRGFEVIMTGMEMIDAVVEAHGRLNEPQGKDEPKSDHPSTFSESLNSGEREQGRR
jgi:hypothetical protein